MRPNYTGLEGRVKIDCFDVNSYREVTYRDACICPAIFFESQFA